MALTWRNVGMPSNAAAAGMMNAAFKNQQQGLTNLRGLGDKFVADRNKAQDKLRTENTDNFRAQYLNANNDAERAAIANNIAGFGGDINKLDLAQSRNKSVDRGQQRLLNETQLRKAQLGNDINAGILGNQEASFRQDADKSAANILQSQAAVNASNQARLNNEYKLGTLKRNAGQQSDIRNIINANTNADPEKGYDTTAIGKDLTTKYGPKVAGETLAYIENTTGFKNRLTQEAKSVETKRKEKVSKATKLAVQKSRNSPKEWANFKSGIMGNVDQDVSIFPEALTGGDTQYKAADSLMEEARSAGLTNNQIREMMTDSNNVDYGGDINIEPARIMMEKFIQANLNK